MKGPTGNKMRNFVRMRASSEPRTLHHSVHSLTIFHSDYLKLPTSPVLEFLPFQHILNIGAQDAGLLNGRAKDSSPLISLCAEE